MTDKLKNTTRTLKQIFHAGSRRRFLRRLFGGVTGASMAGTGVALAAADPGEVASRRGRQDPFIGEIVLFGGNFAPRGWAFCDGQLLSISAYQALYSILGTTYGGDGRTTFALPDLRGRVAIHPGTGIDLSPRTLGETGGAETVALTVDQLPSHTHAIACRNGRGDQRSPVDNVLAGSQATPYATRADATMNAGALASTGDSQPHDNMPPFQGIHYIIALEGLYPSRN